MEWFPLFVLGCSYFVERLFGARLKRTLFQGSSSTSFFALGHGYSFVCLLGILLSVAGTVLHHRYFYSYSFDTLTFFLPFVAIFLFFLNTNVYREFSRSIFQKSLKGEPDGEIVNESNGLLRYIASPLAIDAETCYPHVLILTAAFLLETVVAPIFLFFVGGYVVFGIYFFLYLFLVVLRRQNRFLLELYRGFLFLPGLFSVLLFAFSAFAAGKSFGKVSVAGLLNVREAFSGPNGLLLLNVRAMVAVLETQLAFRFGGEDYIIDYGEEKLSQRTFILTQRLLGIQKFLTYVFSYYLFIVL